MTSQPLEFLKGTTRRLIIPTCSLTADDIRRLYSILDAKSKEATEKQVATIQLPPMVAASAGTNEEQFKQLQETVRSDMRLVVQVESGNGEWMGGTTSQTLSEEMLPDSISRIDYDSSFLFANRLGRRPNNYFILTLDFSKTNLLDLSNPSGEPTANASVTEIGGNDITWVNGVYDELAAC
jgi:hypothetical protein